MFFSFICYWFFSSKTIRLIIDFVKNSGFVVSELVAGSGEQEETRNKKLKTFFWRERVLWTPLLQINAIAILGMIAIDGKKKQYKKVMTLLYNPDQNYLIPRLLRNTVCAVYLLTWYICFCQDYMWISCVILIMKVSRPVLILCYIFYIIWTYLPWVLIVHLSWKLLRSGRPYFSSIIINL